MIARGEEESTLGRIGEALDQEPSELDRPPCVARFERRFEEVQEGDADRRVIVEEGVRVPPGMRIGFGDGSNDFTTSNGGVVVVGGNGYLTHCASTPQRPVRLSRAEDEPRPEPAELAGLASS